jgi:hypothetical protein
MVGSSMPDIGSVVRALEDLDRWDAHALDFPAPEPMFPRAGSSATRSCGENTIPCRRTSTTARPTAAERFGCWRKARILLRRQGGRRTVHPRRLSGGRPDRIEPELRRNHAAPEA